VSWDHDWCRRRDLNPHGLRHTPLKRACLPFHHFGIHWMLKSPTAAFSGHSDSRRTSTRYSTPRILASCGLAVGLFEHPAVRVMSSSGVLSRTSPLTYRQRVRFGVGAPCGLAGKHFEQPQQYVNRCAAQHTLQLRSRSPASLRRNNDLRLVRMAPCGLVQGHFERATEARLPISERERHYRSRPKSLSINGLFCKIGRRLLAG
jgi:hypothetical protein